MLQSSHFNYFWSDFRGHGQLLAGNTLYNFRYECPDTFRQPSAFQARWSKDGKKLDVLLQKPDSHHTEVCTLNILTYTIHDQGIPLLALALLIATPAFAQDGSGPGIETDNPIPGSKLASPATPNPDFPLRVSLRVHGNFWDGSYEFYSGHGKFQIASTDPTTPATSMFFEYECGVTFLKPKVNQFQARWIKPDKTLQVLLYDPDRPSKPRTCNLNALARPLPRMPP